MGWAVAGIATLVALFIFGMWRKGIKEHHHLVQFIILMFLHPDVSEVQRQNFLNLLRRMNAKDATDLGGKVLLAVTRHAVQVTENLTAPIAEGMWSVHTGANT